MMVSPRVRVRRASLALAPVLLLGACSQDGSTMLGGTKQTFGTLIGGAGGGLIGSQFGHGGGKVFATLGGAAVGALVGNYVGAQLDEADRERAEAAAQRALASHAATTVRWSNPKSGNSGTVAVRSIHYERRTKKNTTVARPAPEQAGGSSAGAPPSLGDDNSQAMMDNPGTAGPGTSGPDAASTASVDRDLGTRHGEVSKTIACRTAISTVKLKDQDAQVTESKFCKQPDGTWAPVAA